jgi:cyclic pyranopterin phosphate synthase
MKPTTLELIRKQGLEKGDVLAVAETAGIMAAKETHRLIPLCHPLQLTHIAVEFNLPENSNYIEITAISKGVGKTGFEMEALVAVSVAALTIYDMCKAADKGMTIGQIRLVRKSGGRSGLFLTG